MDLTKVTAETADVVRGVKADQLTAPTPCRDWDVRALVNHLLQVVTAFDIASRGEAIPDDLWARELPVEDAGTRFEETARTAVAAWATPPQTVHMGSNAIPGALAGQMLAADLVIHGWDLARATGQDYHVDADIAEMTRQFVADTGEQGRGMGIYSEPVPVDEDAPAFDRALALSGRDPRWSPRPR
jgi:uncharacterized protein (TIGR03086 family)